MKCILSSLSVSILISKCRLDNDFGFIKKFTALQFNYLAKSKNVNYHTISQEVYNFRIVGTPCGSLMK